MSSPKRHLLGIVFVVILAFILGLTHWAVWLVCLIALPIIGLGILPWSVEGRFLWQMRRDDEPPLP